MIVIGDIHLKAKQPYITHLNNFLTWLLYNYNDEKMLFLGDIFQSSAPRWDTFNVMKQFLYYRKNSTYILTGNHDRSSNKGNAIRGLQYSYTKRNLELIKNVFIYEDKEIVDIDGIKWMMLPYIHGEGMKKYEEITDTVDICATHVVPMECAFVGEGIQLNVDTKLYIHGHTHIATEFVDKYDRQHSVIGVPIATRHGEFNKGVIYNVKDADNIDVIDVPMQLVYENVEFGDEPKDKNSVINILNAPDPKSAVMKYKEHFIRSVQYKKYTDEISVTCEFKTKTKENFLDLAKKEEYDSDLINTCLYYLDFVEDEVENV